MLPNIAFYAFIGNHVDFNVWVLLFKLFHYAFAAIAHSSLRKHCYCFDVFIFTMVGKKFKKLCFGILICALSYFVVTFYNINVFIFWLRFFQY